MTAPLDLHDRGLPGLGVLLDFRKGPAQYLRAMHDRHGPVVAIRLGNMDVVSLGTPELVESFLVGEHASCHKDAITRKMKRVIGDGLLLSEGALWRRQRKLCAPALTARHVARYADDMRSLTRAFCDRRADDEVIEAHGAMTDLTLQIVVRTLFGVASGVDAERVGGPLTGLIDEGLAEARGWRRFLPERVPTPGRVRFMIAQRRLDAIIYEVIAAGNEDDSLLGRLLAARDDDGAPMPERLVRDEVVTLFLAGHETTSLTLAYALYLLAGHRRVWARLAEEARALPDDPTSPAELPYCRAVLDEVLRLYPPAFLFGREVIAPVAIGGVTLPVGTQVLVSPYLLQRDPALWEEPESFRPERFVDAPDRPRFANFPFGGGPRICIGNHFALLEMVLVLGVLARRFELRSASSVPLAVKPSVTLRPVGPLPVRLVRRTDG